MKSIPKSRREGEAAGIKMLRQIEKMYWDRNAPVMTARQVDAQIRASIDWPADARRGFTYIIAEWLRTEVLGLGYNLDGYERCFRRVGRAGTRDC